MSTLLHGGFSENELGHEMCTMFAKLLESSLYSGGGLLGFGGYYLHASNPQCHMLSLANKPLMSLPISMTLLKR